MADEHLCTKNDDDDGDALLLLRPDRDYMSIGIGNVFASMMLFVDDAQQQQQVVDDDDDDEWVGTIKEKPQDFVVREISLDGLVADLSLTLNDINSNSYNLLVHKAVINNDHQHKDDGDVTAFESARVQRQRKKRKVEQQQQPTCTGTSSDMKNDDDDDDKNNVHDNGKNNNNNNSAIPQISNQEEHDVALPQLAAVLATIPVLDPWTSVDDLLANLTALNQRATTRISSNIPTAAATTATTSTDEKRTGATTIHNDNDDDSTTTITIPSVADRELRTQLHQALARAFPLLDSQTIKEGGSSNSSMAIAISIDQRFNGLAGYLQNPVDDLSQLLRLYRHAWGQSASSLDRCHRHNLVRLRCKDGLARADRRPVHRIIGEKSHFMLHTNTVTTTGERTGPATAAMIEVSWAPRKNSASADGGMGIVRTLGVIKKTGCEHSVMMKVLSQRLRLRRGTEDLSVAGIKDMQAETYQFCVVSSSNSSKNASRHRRHHASPPVPQSAIYIQNHKIEFLPLGPVSKQLERGELRGNRFELVIRNVRRRRAVVGVGTLPPLCEQKVLHRFQTKTSSWFVNYYGEQRVGEPGDAAVVGVRAPDIGRAMLQRNYDRAVDLILTGRKMVQGRPVVAGGAVDEFRRVWRESGKDAAAVMNAVKDNIPFKERAILTALKRFPNDPLAALRSMPFHDRMLYINAYQALVWNHAATQRLLLYGGQVVPGDLVVTDPSALRQVKVVVAGEEAQFHMAQVVLPLPGWNVAYPQHAVAQVYEQMLAKDSITLTRNKDDGEAESSAKGSYRFLVAKPHQPVQCHKVDGSDSDYRLTFDLSAGCYATMFLRELLRTKSTVAASTITTIKVELELSGTSDAFAR